jgi:hypothetical protein
MKKLVLALTILALPTFLITSTSLHAEEYVAHYSRTSKNPVLTFCNDQEVAKYMMMLNYNNLSNEQNNKIKSINESEQCTYLFDLDEKSHVDIHLDKKPPFMAKNNGERMFFAEPVRGWVLKFDVPTYYWFNPYEFDLDIYKL